MKRNDLILAALVILVISAVWFVANLSSVDSEAYPGGDTISVGSKDSILGISSIDSSSTILQPDSMVELGSLGYSILMPDGLILEKNHDSSFTIRPSQPIGDCAKLELQFSTDQEWPVIGRRPTRILNVNILGRNCTFRNYQSIGYPCEWRTGAIGIDSASISVYCSGKAGEEIERMFDVATSLQKSQ